MKESKVIGHNEQLTGLYWVNDAVVYKAWHKASGSLRQYVFIRKRQVKKRPGELVLKT